VAVDHGVQRRQQRHAGADRHLDQNTGVDEGRVEFFDLDIGDHTAIVDLWIDLCEPSGCFLAALVARRISAPACEFSGEALGHRQTQEKATRTDGRYRFARHDHCDPRLAGTVSTRPSAGATTAPSVSCWVSTALCASVAAIWLRVTSTSVDSCASRWRVTTPLIDQRLAALEFGFRCFKLGGIALQVAHRARRSGRRSCRP
jgi:hypothetical protein